MLDDIYMLTRADFVVCLLALSRSDRHVLAWLRVRADCASVCAVLAVLQYSVCLLALSYLDRHVFALRLCAVLCCACGTTATQLQQ